MTPNHARGAARGAGRRAGTGVRSRRTKAGERPGRPSRPSVRRPAAAPCLTAAGLAAAGLLGFASAAAAQAPMGDEGDDGLPPARAAVGIFAGSLSPLNDLTEDPASFGTFVSVAPALGAELTLWPRGGRIGVELQGVFAPGELKLRATEFQGAVPDDLGNSYYWAGSATVLYRLRPAGVRGRVEPYFGIGAGLRHLAVEAIASPEVEDATDPLATVAAGTDVWFSRGLAIRFEVRDHLLSFESPTAGDSKLQNDVLVTVGATVRLR